MENCLYQGKTICTFDLKDDNGLYYEDLVLGWKQAAALRQLTCMDCGAYVYLAAGPVKEPYFAHYDLVDCEYGSGNESEELKKGKRLLYHLLKRSFPGGDIRARYRLENGMYSTLYCIAGDGKEFAVDYRLQNNSLMKFNERASFYQSNGIKPIYILGNRKERNTKQVDWYQNLLQSSMGYLAFIDTGAESMTLKKSIGYRLGSERKYASLSKTYPISELFLNPDGQMLCDFSKECARLEDQIKAEKIRYEKRQENLRRIREENQKHKDEEDMKLAAYRRSITSKEKPALDPVLLEKCRRMIKEGNAHLVSKKYYDAIMSEEYK